jgi:O-Antigen ligase
MEIGHIRARLRHPPAFVPGFVAVGVMLVWAVHNGGYDADTWYWGTLVLAAVLAALLIARGRPRLSRASAAALAFFALYVAWSYLSIAWAQSPGDALEGSNRALLYLLLFALMLALPWTPKGALTALIAFVLGVGVIAIVLLVRLASADHLAGLVIGGRLSAPTGYFNATAALFTMDALAATVLATRRELPPLLRGVLIAFACAGLQLAVTVQSRGWLFTLPLVLIVAIAVVPDRLRVAAAAVFPVAAVALQLRPLLNLFDTPSSSALDHAASRAGHAALLTCVAAFLLGTLIAWRESRVELPGFTRTRRRLVGAAVTAIVIVAVSIAGVGATHGHPFSFISRQWHGFSHPETTFSSASHFGDVGSGRYDYWRVALDAVVAHPIGGLGQDNFADYYVKRRHTAQEPEWTHSLELRLLAQTGLVGFGLFAAFLIAALTAAARARRRDDALIRAVAGIALLPLIVWLIHGSIDWFWEIPALSGPALGFLGLAGALSTNRAREPAGAVAKSQRSAVLRISKPIAVAGTIIALSAALVVVAMSYLSVREVSLATNARQNDPAAALRDLSRAAKLNPLSADPGRLGGAIALQTGAYATAEQRFSQSISREPGGWYSWLGRGLAESALGDSGSAHQDFETARSINSQQAAVRAALTRVDTHSPLTPTEASKLLVDTQ